MGKTLDNVLKAMEKRFSKEAVRTLESAPIEIKRIPTGSKDLDDKIGGGYPVGRIIEILGGEAVGKTTLALSAIVKAQELGLICAIVDSEHALNKEYAQNLGVDTSKLIISQPGTGEEALNIVEELCRSGADLVVVDSVATMTPEKEIQGEMEDNNIGLQARMMSKGLRKITPAASDSDTTILFINQFRTKIGAYGDPNVGTGGMALPYYASVRLKMYASKLENTKKERIGSRVKIKVAKNKTASPYRTAEYSLIFGVGIDELRDTIDMAVYEGLIVKSGSWYKYDDGTSLGQGVEGVRDVLKDNPDLLDDIEIRLEEMKNGN